MLPAEQLLKQSRHFCMMPWIQLHVWPSGQAYPCCLWDSSLPVGKHGEERYGGQTDLLDLWNAPRMRELRQNMLADRPTDGCGRCYTLEAEGFPTMRQMSNQYYSHHWDLVEKTTIDGRSSEMRMAYMDIRFSNFCNLRCQTCGPELSSAWFEDQTKLYGTPPHPKLMQVSSTPGFWDELKPQLAHVEQAYFAGGEPLACDEHYEVLDHWLAIGKTDVRIIYTTNFTLLEHKKARVLEYWKKFSRVQVAASLDDSGRRAEYLRKGTVWERVEKNRETMMRECPDIPFEITPTISAFNAWHFPDFHLDWVERGLIDADAATINVLTHQAYHSVRIFPQEYKELVAHKYEDTISKLRAIGQRQGVDIGRVEDGYRAVINFMMGADDRHLLPEFFRRLEMVNKLRKEPVFEIYPELRALWLSL